MNSFELFLNTVAIVLGVLSPILLLVIIYAIGQVYQSSKQYHMHQREREKKLHPYDEITLEEVPNPTMYNVKMWRNGEVVHEQGVDKI